MDGGRTYATPIINQIGVYTKRSGKRRKETFDNSPYGQILPQVKKNIFKTIRTVGHSGINGS
jgi:hypothetical protein